MKKIIGLVGTGYWGKNIFRNFYEMGSLHTVCDSNPAVLSEFKQNFPNAHYISSLSEMLSNPSIKGIAFATPAVTHYEFTKQALKAGKDVFVEKPLSLTVEQGAELLEVAKDNKRILMVGHILHYHPAVKKLKELITSKVIGEIYYIYSNRLNIGKLRTEENVLWSLAPHDISVVLSLAGEEPVTIDSFAGAYLQKEIYDMAVITLKFSTGVKSHISVNWLNPFKEQKLVVIGSKGMLVFDDTLQEKLFLYPHKIEWIDGKIPVAQKSESQVIPVEKGEPLRLELEHFVECIETRKTPLTDGLEGLRVLKVLEEAEKSILNKRSTV
jgi:UDP-2-acetamido-3-amino-2,3-dideoxy-glucuronate N-acetyltransferase